MIGPLARLGVSGRIGRLECGLRWQPDKVFCRSGCKYHDESGAMSVNVVRPRVQDSVVRLLVLIPLIAGFLVFVGWYVQSGTQEGRGHLAGLFQEVQIAAGSGKVTMNITVNGFRAGSVDDLYGFKFLPGDRDKTPYYVWFTAKVTSGSFKPEDPFPIMSDQWGAVSSVGETLKGVRLGAELQPCPQINTERLSAGEPAEGCFMAFSETGQELVSASLNLDGHETYRWNFQT